MGIKIGIDLGTTYSAVAFIPEGGVRPQMILNPEAAGNSSLVPSVIQFLETGEVIVGTEAKDAMEAGEYGCASVFKREMGENKVYCSFYGKDYTAEDLSAILLCYLRKMAEEQTGQEVEEAVITVPAYFYDEHRTATMNAARKAGLNVRMLINEPTAAAMNYGTNFWDENARIMVYDLGGGTFDITLVQMEKGGKLRSVGTLGNHRLGGKDWDNELQKILMEKIREGTGIDLTEDAQMKYVIAQMAETIKRKLTDMTKYTVKINVPDYGKYETEVTREEFEQKTCALLEQTKSLCAKMLEDCHYNWKDVTDVLLVGGSTRMPQVSAFLEKIIHKKPLCKVNPDEAVAIGAAIQVNLPKPKYHVLSVMDEETDKQKNTFFSAPVFRKKTPAVPSASSSGKSTSGALQIFSEDVVAHALGVLAVNKESTAYINKTIIPANQLIPVKYAESFHFYTSPDKENTLDIFMLQGTEPPLRAKIVGNCRYVASGIRHSPEKNPTLIRIQYSYDANGMVHVQVRQEDDDYDLPIQKTDLPADIEKYGKPIDPKELPAVHEPVSVMMAIDVSGSMAGKPIDNAKKAMLHFVQQLQNYSGQSRIGIITVSDSSEIIESPTDSAHVLTNRIQSVSVGRNGYGNSAHPFQEIKESLRKCKGRKIGIVLADGVWSYQDEAIRKAKECHQNGIDIVGVGFGSADENFLRRISSGNIKSIMTSQDKLVKSFGSIAQEIGGQEGKKKNSGKRKPTATWKAVDEE